MKSIHLCLIAVLFTLAGPKQLPGQHASSQIVTRGHVATLPASATAAAPVSDSQSNAVRPGQVPSNEVVSLRSNALPTPPQDARAFPTLTLSRDRNKDGADRTSDTTRLSGHAITVIFSLALVLGLFAGLVWITRKFGSRSISQGSIPKEVLEGLGSTPIDARTRITLIRCGNRILVIAQTPTGIHPLTEITDPDEVRELTATCIGDSKQAFATALRSIEKEQAGDGYLGVQTETARPPGRERLFASA
jgi:flagellar biosynthetic protein FliO